MFGDGSVRPGFPASQHPLTSVSTTATVIPSAVEGSASKALATREQKADSSTALGMTGGRIAILPPSRGEIRRQPGTAGTKLGLLVRGRGWWMRVLTFNVLSLSGSMGIQVSRRRKSRSDLGCATADSEKKARTRVKLKLLSVIALAGACCMPSYATTDFSGTSIPVPSGLVQGDTFQLVFLTNETFTAGSTSISTYNSDVTTSAGASGSLVAGLGITWSALVSTASVNVLSNIVNTSPSMTGFAGIYDFAGNLIADGTETAPNGLYSGSLQNVLYYVAQGSPLTTYAWTGTDAAGATENALGTGSPEYGQTNLTSGSWTSLGQYTNSAAGTHMYAISNLLVLGPSDQIEIAPEPATVWMTLFGLAACYFAVKRKRRIAPPTAPNGATPELR